MRHFGIVAMICMVVSACGGTASVLTSTKLTDPSRSVAKGVIYSLPQTWVSLTATVGEKKFPTAEQVKMIAQLNARIAKLKDQIQALEKDVEGKKPDDEKKKRTELAQHQAELKTENEKLSAVWARVSTKRGVSSSVKLATVTPDPEHTYNLAYIHDSGSNDTIEIQTSQSGLLVSISTSTRDETAAIVKDVIGVAGDAAVFFATGGFVQAADALRKTSAANQQRASCAYEQDFTATFVINPVAVEGKMGEHPVAAKFNDLSKGTCFTVKVYDAALKAYQPWSRDTADIDEEKGTDVSSPRIYYRRLGTMFIEVTHEALPNLTGVIMLKVPQAGTIGSIDIQRRALVENKAEADFEHGMLKRLKYVDPSEDAAIASIPIDFLEELFGIPGEIINTTSSQVEAEAKLVESRAKLIEAEIRLEEARAKRRGQQSIDQMDE